jgi:hypothetical protein
MVVPTAVDATAQHRIPIDVCNWRIGVQWNPVRKLWFFAILTSQMFHYR